MTYAESIVANLKRGHSVRVSYRGQELPVTAVDLRDERVEVEGGKWLPLDCVDQIVTKVNRR